MTNKKAIMHVLSHTHWDREWYQDFQGYRQRLVFQIDMLMDLLEQKPDFKHFHLDGQTSCLLDYLQIRPESRERLEKHIQSGQILIGPWFVMPDELLLSGESIVRNLMLGHALCADFGTDSMPVGYVTDIFGHCSQLPQILRSFGIDTAFLHRGTSTEDEKTEMLWEGADGSDVLLIKVYPYTGYQDFLVLRDSSDESLLEYEERKLNLSTTNVLFTLDGNDHQPAYWTIPDYIKRINKIFKHTKLVHSSMLKYLHELRKALGDDWRTGLKKFTGELRMPNKSGTYAELFYGTASSRVNLKQENDALEYLLPRIAEPLHTWSIFVGGDNQKPFLNLAWNYLLLNHPHDSIVGCSLDQVHKDMMYRFDQSRLIAQNSIWESVLAIDEKLNTLEVGGEGKVVTLHNSSTADIGPVNRFFINLRKDIVEQNAKEGLVPALVDADGNVIPYVVDSQIDDVYSIPLVRKDHGTSPKFSGIPDYWMPASRTYITANVSVPANGYKTLKIAYVTPDKQKAASDITYDAIQNTSANTIENEFIKAEANANGAINLLDKQNNKWYKNIHSLEDCGDNGDGWDHVYPENDNAILSTDDGAISGISASVTAKSNMSASLAISYMMKVPAELKKDRKYRSSKLVSIPITSIFTLDSGSKMLKCKTIIDNKAKNHRMRALFPTGLNTSVWFADTAFDVVKRNIKLPDTTGWMEQAREESPVKNFAAVCSSETGLAVITKGLCEAAVQDNPQRSIALTLFRGFDQNIGGYITEESQMPGRLEFEYAIHPFTPADGNPPASIMQEVERFKIPLIALTTDAHSGDMPASGKFMELPDELTLSTVKLSENNKAAIIRIFNTNTYQVDGDLRISLPFKKAWKSSPMECKLEKLETDNGAIPLSVGPKEILTIRIKL